MLVYPVPLLYTFILVMLAWIQRHDNSSSQLIPTVFPISRNGLFWILLVVSLIVIGVSQLFIAPKISLLHQDHPQVDISKHFFSVFLFLAVSEMSVVFALINGIFNFIYWNAINWLHYLILFGIGWIILIFNHRRKIPAIYRF